MTVLVLCTTDDGGAATPLDAGNVSVCSDEGLDVSQQFAETVFTGSSLDADAEEIVSGANCSCAFSYRVLLHEHSPITR